jgi:glutamyl-tRNA synthetase
MAIASLLARLGTADPVIPQRHMRSVIDLFDLGKFGRATAKFDPSELAKLNSQIVQELDFANVESRLANIGVTANAEFWLAVRGNLATVDEARVWWDICTQPIKPVIEASAVTNAAAALLPAGDLDSQIWSPWTKSIAAETGAKGKLLFMPLRLALTGRDAGPEIAPLLAIMGRERVIRRLQGDAA